MKVRQGFLNRENVKEMLSQKRDSSNVLLLVFFSRSIVEKDEFVQEFIKGYENAQVIGCSTSGEIINDEVSENSVTFTEVEFEHTQMFLESVAIKDFKNSLEAGRNLGTKFVQKSLKHLFVLSDGLQVNGSELVKGLNEALPSQVSITGGLAGDGDCFEKTYLIAKQKITEGQIIAVGFQGDKVHFSHGTLGGWEPFGIERIVTKSEGNVLCEIDDRPALELYKEYLGEELSAQLPSSALLFPICLIDKEANHNIVRTILNVNHEDNSMTFAGDIPQGEKIQLMKSNVNGLIDGAHQAAENCKKDDPKTPSLAIMISCVGRKLVMKQMVDDEIEAVREVLGDTTVNTGFYSYGEICPYRKDEECKLHNQTMTITTIREDD